MAPPTSQVLTARFSAVDQELIKSLLLRCGRSWYLLGQLEWRNAVALPRGIRKTKAILCGTL